MTSVILEDNRDTDVGMAIRKSITRSVVASTGLHEEIAVNVADRIFRELSAEFGGGRLWWPSLNELDERDREIRRRWRDGETWCVLCGAYGLSRSQLYRIVNGMRSGSAL